MSFDSCESSSKSINSRSHKKSIGAASRRSKLLDQCCDIYKDASTENNCEEDFTLSGSDPPKTVGPLSKRHDLFAKYAPCGHWSTCAKNSCGVKQYYDACKTCFNRAPYGPYGPWSKTGPAKFISPRQDYIKKVFPTPKRRHNGNQRGPNQPMGKLAPWPLSGSCRYGGRPYGPCRPFGAFKSRGPFGAWTCKTWPEYWRPKTPSQPCWKPKKGGCRPCTPCHRPLFRPCKPCCDV